ncbi:recombination-associated protein RdgC [Comamonas sp. SY3]|uniref:recombination-associated protein RdgC n=1 Tax=Comamonas sp. SY3 TaxID=3243601 RepID=UPI003593892D
MKAVTRNLFTYSAEILATVQELQLRLQPFEPCGEHQRASWGFVNVVPDTEDRVLAFPGGWAICLREDSRTVPASEVSKLVDEKARSVYEATGRKPGRKERKEMQADVIYELLPRAFVRSKVTYIVYSHAKQRLYVNTGSQKTADLGVSALVQVLESVKFSTVHVSGPKMGLTARLTNWLRALADDGSVSDDDMFGVLQPASEIVMVGVNNKWALKLAALENARESLQDALRQGAQVDSMCFTDADGVMFRVTSELRLKGVKHQVVEDDDCDITHLWVSQLASEVVTLDGIFDTLLELLSPEKAQADTPTVDDIF